MKVLLLKSNKVIGLMCGTSVDALDIALCDISKTDKINVKLLKFDSISIPNELKAKIFKSFTKDINSRFLCSLNFEIAQFYALCVNEFLVKNNINNQEIDYIASHGQTIYHLIDPSDNETKSTLQIGDISVIAKLTKITTIGDFRPADMALDGQGAPLVVYPDYLLFSSNKVVRLLQNIGGMSNVTVLNSNLSDVYAFDNGPGNVLIDMATKHFFNQDFDKNASHGLKGFINQDIVNFLLKDEYYSQKPPKSTGREKYNSTLFNKILAKWPGESPENIICSLTYFTAHTIASSYKNFVFQTDKKYEIYVSGGGSRNPLMMKYIKELLPHYKVETSELLGINPDAKEAIEFALLGYLTWNKLPGNLPGATGASDFTILGKIAF